jgi:hypothetical protein
MNWTAWNSVCANALANSPSDMPSSAFSTANATTTTTEPSTSRPSSPNATVAVISACTVAASAKARP